MKYRHLVLSILSIALVSCGDAPALKLPSQTPSEDKTFVDELVVKARATSLVTTGNSNPANALAAGSQPVSVVVAASTSMTMDSSQFSVPALTGNTLDLGILAISALRDNDLRVCGTNGKTKCTRAVIRMYTSGEAGAGLWNTLDGYGAPLKAGIVNSSKLTPGLNPAGAVTLQEYTITSSKNVLNLSDLNPAPSYAIEADFSNAGAGTYQTTIVLEFGLAL